VQATSKLVGSPSCGTAFMAALPRNLVFAVCKDRLLSLSFRRLVKFDKRKSRLLQNCDELACYGKTE